MSRLLRGRDGLTYFTALRHLSPRLWVVSALAHESTRFTAEAAVNRFADWSRPPPFPYEPPGWTGATLRRVATLLVLAESFASTASNRRRIAKGQLVEVVSTAPLDFKRDDNTELGHLIRTRDARVQADSNSLASLGGLFVSMAHHDHGVPGKPPLLASEWVPPSEFAFRLNGAQEPWETFADGLRVPLREVVCRQGIRHDAAEEAAAVAPYDAALRGIHDFGVADLDRVLRAVSGVVLRTWGTCPRTLERHGFVIAPLPSEEDIRRVDSEPGREEATAMRAYSAALAFLDAGRHPTTLDQPLLRRPLRTLGSLVVYDCLDVGPVGPLLWDIPIDDALRRHLSRQFETAVHTLLGGLGTQPWPSGRIVRYKGQHVTDVDASVQIGDLMVVVDCYSSPWSPALDSGSHAATRNRAQSLLEKLDKWDAQWRNMVDRGIVRFPAGTSAVLPVVVTSGPEWIPSGAETYWLSSTMPRICTAEELKRYLIAEPRAAPHGATIGIRP